MKLPLPKTTTGVITVLGACGSANAFMTPPTRSVSALIKPNTTTERTTQFSVLPLAPHNGLRSPRPAGTALLSALNDNTKPNNSAPTNYPTGADQITSPNSPKAVTTMRKGMDQDGYALVTSVPKPPSAQLLKNLTTTLRAAHAPANRKRPNDRIYIRWQRQPKMATKRNASLPQEEKNTPSAEKDNSPWMLTDTKNCDQQRLVDFPEQDALFDAATSFFDALHAQMRAAFPGDKLVVTQEVRYIDPLDHAEVSDTYWHCDLEPTFLTATASWIGPGTIYLSAESLADLGDYPQHLSTLKNVTGTETPKGTALSFYGQAGATEPLWHKSPASAQPRLLLIYRLTRREDAIAIRAI